MDRKDIDKSLKWDTEKIYKTDEEFYKEVEEVKNLIEKTKAYKGKILQSADSLYDFLKTDEKLERKFSKLGVYASLKSDEDTRVAKYQEMSKIADNLFANLAQELSFITPEILSEDYKKVQTYIEEKEELKIYDHYFEDLFRNKDHTLGENEEKIIASFAKLSQNPQNTYMIFSNADLKFPKVKKGDEEIQITDANFTNLELDSNREFRKEVYEKYYTVYKQFENTAASLLDGEMTANNTIAKLKKFDSARAMSLFANNIDEKVYDNLIEVIHDNIEIHRDYTSLRKEVLGLDDLGFYDIYLPLVEDYNKTYTFDEAKELILKALAPLGEDYIKKAREGFEDRWFDVMENEGKRSGGYSSGSYDTEPYILLNYNDSLDSLFTTAHELGHSMHSYYTRKTQPYIYGDYSIFLAEIASTTNELLLLNYMIDHAKDEKEKAYLLNHYVNSFKSTVFRQTMFAEFELEANKLVENSMPVTAEKLNQIYHDLNVDYFGEDIEVDKYISTEWARIPHFYMFYYVFQYATGFSSAVSLSEKILHGDDKDLEKYLNFLKAGKSKYPIEVLKDAGVDMTKKDSLQKAMDACKEKLEELKKSLEK
ncbi:MAG: oligoendopeptidase F [Anaerococcus vaginalis]|uniref:oligoendopeptidase F n=1 Tax=Anaerococcus vaginalis TaxID=33037 RepID=UPI002901A9FD|nr:oligoendopeptidase F [Anaerococcus vaginalis]MDU1707552.1 oligoendopeptidase F [Anaerococcus vaginalis]MDU1763161.1 oligoendopeptidase F [Anaerococcus vaginalis]